jgi:hypothetical protein
VGASPSEYHSTGARANDFRSLMMSNGARQAVHEQAEEHEKVRHHRAQGPGHACFYRRLQLRHACSTSPSANLLLQDQPLRRSDRCSSYFAGLRGFAMDRSTVSTSGRVWGDDSAAVRMRSRSTAGTTSLRTRHSFLARIFVSWSGV